MTGLPVGVEIRLPNVLLVSWFRIVIVKFDALMTVWRCPPTGVAGQEKPLIENGPLQTTSKDGRPVVAMFALIPLVLGIAVKPSCPQLTHGFVNACFILWELLADLARFG